MEFGIASIVFSIYLSSQILAFIGLGLTFWGAIFILTVPKRYVKSDLLVSGIYPEYSNFDRIANYLGTVEKAYYIPSYLRIEDVPENLTGLKEPIVFVSAEPDFKMLPVEDISEGKFLPSKNKGVLLTPPGLGILKRVEEKIKATQNDFGIKELCEALPRLILEDSDFAKEMTMNLEEENVHLTIKDSIYKSLYNSEEASKSIKILGCPITSAIACLLAQASRKTVTIAKTEMLPDGSTIETDYHIIG